MSRFSPVWMLLVPALASFACAGGGVEDPSLGKGGQTNGSGGGSNGGSGNGGSGNGGSGNGGATTAMNGGATNPNGGASNGSGGAKSGNGGATTAMSGGATTMSGGATGSGGSTTMSGGVSGSCMRTVGSCTAPTVQVTDITLPNAAIGYGQEGDTNELPMAIAAKPSGGSRIAWLGSDKKNVYVGELGCDDKLTGTPFSFPAIDLQDLYADDDGGVVLVTRDATGSGTDHCGSGMLCGGTSSPCKDMYMIRFDNSGKSTWETKVTNLSATLDGYQNNARFVWWYQHHGRLAYDGANYAAYFGVAITVNNGSCVDIHEGDRMQVIDGSGKLLTGHDSFEVGCSHAWTSRIVWDPRSKHFMMVCATDNNCRIARPNPYKTIATGTCDGTLFGGDLVLATNAGYWTAWSQGGTIRLQHFTDSGPDTAVANAGSSQHPHLVTYSTDKMLVTWGTGTSMTAQVRDAGANADAIGSTFTIPANDHSYQAWKSYADGSVAYPAAGANTTSMKIARVMPCN